MSIDDVARRAMKNNASRLREVMAQIRALDDQMKALMASYDALEARLGSIREDLLTEAVAEGRV